MRDLAMLPEKETITVEFKSDRKRLPDRELVEAVMSMANTDGGELYVGVEDDGTPTGLHADHRNISGLAALIANRTNPPLSVRVEMIHEAQVPVAKILVPKSRQLVATSEGLLQRRRLKADGTPEAIPFYPHEFIQRHSSMGLLDHSAIPLSEASTKDLDPLERERLRQIIERYGGDQALLSLSDPELDGALRITVRETDTGRPVPTLAGLLLLGREASIRQFIPAHEVAFQVLEGTNVKGNEFFRAPLLKAFEIVLEKFKARLEEEEVQTGLFRVPVPNYDTRAFREGLVNALIHRDYARLGAVHVRLEDSGLSISNPGGFVEGVTLKNLLTVEPRPRNPLLADNIKRIGLAERTGRGVDLIYEGLLRYGRPAPDYSRSDSTGVVLKMSNAVADTDFLQMILQEEERTGGRLPLDSLITLARLREERRLTTTELAESIQKSEPQTRGVLERLVEAGMIEALGTGRGRTYILSAQVYRHSGGKSRYVRQAGFNSIQQRQMVLQYLEKHDRIKRSDVAELCRISPFQATRLLTKMVEEGEIRRHGKLKGTYYERIHS